MDSESNLKPTLHNTSKDKHSIILYGLGGLGVFVFSLGIISIIASNWYEIKPSIKLFVYFILQSSFGVGYLKLPSNKLLTKEALLHLFAIGWFGGLGLIAQIFQLSGGMWEPLAFWLLLTFAAALIVEIKLLPHLWWIIFFIMLLFLLLDMLLLNHLILDVYIAITLFVIAVGFSASNQNLKIKLPTSFTEAAILYGFAIIIVYASIHGTILCYYANDLSDGFTYKSITEAIIDKINWLYFPSLIVFFSMYFRAPPLKPSIKKAIAALLVIINLFVSLPIYLPFMQNKVCGALWFILLWLCVAWNSVLLSYKNFYHLAVIIIILRFILIYIEIFYDLLFTGAGLIISGLLFLIMAFLWGKYQKVLSNWIEHE